jgi:precorrin-6A/cobalt-precorrin-6A reductase
VIDPPDFAVPASWELIRARGPFALDDELALLRDHAIDVIVTKDSGGPVSAKLDAAAQLDVPVVVVRRPPLPAGVQVVRTVADAASWVHTLG